MKKKKEEKNNRRKSDEPVSFGKLKMPRGAFRFLIAALCATAWLIFSANFECANEYFKCGSKPIDTKINIEKGITK